MTEAFLLKRNGSIPTLYIEALEGKFQTWIANFSSLHRNILGTLVDRRVQHSHQVCDVAVDVLMRNSYCG